MKTYAYKIKRINSYFAGIEEYFKTPVKKPLNVSLDELEETLENLHPDDICDVSFEFNSVKCELSNIDAVHFEFWINGVNFEVSSCEDVISLMRTLDARNIAVDISKNRD